MTSQDNHLSLSQVCAAFCAVKYTTGASAAATAVLSKFGLSVAGFGAAGVSAGSWAAAAQSALYGGLTPAGGWFATATSWAMTGATGPVAACAAGATAAVYAAGWACGCPL